VRGSNHDERPRRTLRLLPPVQFAPPSADVFEWDDAVYVDVTGPATTRVLCLEVRLDSGATNGDGQPKRSTGQGERSVFRIHPDATPS
jgi:hypothetical protein